MPRSSTAGPESCGPSPTSPDTGPPYAGRVSRKRWYFVLMGTCIGLILVAWNVVRLYSTTAAVVMSVVAALLPPTAAIVANPPWQRRDRP